jgi:hypothetical protein
MATNATNAVQHSRTRLPGVIDSHVTSFTPASISNISLWYAANSITGKVDGDAIASWSDLSGNGNNMVQATGTKQPLYKTGQVNGLPALRFDSTDDAMGTTYSVSNPFSAFVVYAWTGTGGARRVLNGANNWLLGPRSDTGSNYKYYNSNFIVGPALSANTWVYETVTQDSGGATFRHNGASQGTNANNTAPGGLVLGAGGGFPEAAASDIAEIIFYSRLLTSDEVALVEGYLKSKYGL